MTPERPNVRLSPDEAWRMITDAHTGVLTTLRRDGVPVALPLWFVALDRRIYVNSLAATKKVARIRHDGRASFLVEAGARFSELRAVHLTGQAVVIDDDPALGQRVAEAIDEKYRGFRADRSTLPEPSQRHYAATSVVVAFLPDERYVSWDNRRLHAR
jgi:nitroimidazol reductase NimA-like FMN-containing flavoprotein (pyridoxamine 5'-phosphate oxidase superfamily)